MLLPREECKCDFQPLVRRIDTAARQATPPSLQGGVDWFPVRNGAYLETSFERLVDRRCAPADGWETTT
jgi:hypothetical protein